MASVIHTTETEGICPIIGGKQLHSYSKGSQRTSDTSLVFSPWNTAVLCFPHLWLGSIFCNRLYLPHFKANCFILESIPLPTSLPSLTPGVIALCPSQQLPPRLRPSPRQRTPTHLHFPSAVRVLGVPGHLALVPPAFQHCRKTILAWGEPGHASGAARNAGRGRNGMGLPAPKHVH